MNGHTNTPDSVERIRVGVSRTANLPGMIPARQYVSDVTCVLRAYDAVMGELDREREATRANFEMYERAQDEIDRLTAEVMLLRKEQRGEP